MIFIYPMWDNESQRIGKMKCTPLGYKLHVFAEFLGFFGLILGFGILVYLLYRFFVGTFNTPLLWFLGVPFVPGFIGEALFQYSWWLAYKKGFRYDYETREASWLEEGERRIYKWKA